MPNYDESGFPNPARGHWSPRLEQLCFLAAFGLLGLAAVFAHSYDLELLRAIHSSPTAAAVSFWKGVSFLGSGDFLAPVVTLTSLILLRAGQGISALGMVLGWATCGMTVEWLKWLIERGRPPVPQLDYIVGPAFPSSHAAQSLYVYGYLWILFATSGRQDNSSPHRKTYGRIISPLFAALPIVVGLSRLYLGLHWPSDVLAGWGIGLFFSGVALLTKPNGRRLLLH